MSPFVGRSGFAVGVLALAGLVGFELFGGAAAEPVSAPAQLASNVPIGGTSPATPADHKKMLMQYCTACHNDKLKTAGMSVVPLDANNLQADQATWEKILH